MTATKRMLDRKGFWWSLGGITVGAGITSDHIGTWWPWALGCYVTVITAAILTTIWRTRREHRVVTEWNALPSHMSCRAERVGYLLNERTDFVVAAVCRAERKRQNVR